MYLKKNPKTLATNYVHVLGTGLEQDFWTCWDPAMFPWVLPSKNPTQIWPSYYTEVQKHGLKNRGSKKDETVVQ